LATSFVPGAYPLCDDPGEEDVLQVDERVVQSVGENEIDS
jgi:hypothetical protein